MDKYQVPPKIEKHLKKNDRFWRNIHRKKKVIAFITYSMALACFVLIGKSCWDGYWRTYQWEWRTPVIFQTPLMIKKLKPVTQEVVSPMPKEDKKLSMTATEAKLTPLEPTLTSISQAKNGKIIEGIWTLESTRGTNTNPYALHNICRARGQFNEFGYAAQCFPSAEYVVGKIDIWLTRELETKTLAQTLCYYNTGHVMNDCPYYQNYLSL